MGIYLIEPIDSRNSISGKSKQARARVRGRARKSEEEGGNLIVIQPGPKKESWPLSAP